MLRVVVVRKKEEKKSAFVRLFVCLCDEKPYYFFLFHKEERDRQTDRQK